MATLCGQEAGVTSIVVCCQAEILFLSDNETSGTGFLIEYSVSYGMFS